MHKLSFHIWDGVSQPLLLEQEYPHSGFESVSMSEGVLLLARFQKELSARAHPRPRQPGSAEIRRQVAGSMLQTFRRMSGPHEQLGLHDRAGFIEAVHLVETACFFDPDNAHAQVLRITCRWGWWMDFGFTVKNQFWSRWRRSRAWGKYVEHFGLQPVSVPLPFPYDRNGIAGIYVESLAELVRRFPERIETEEEAKGQWSRTKEAQAHGFPREMPPPVIAQWKTQLEAELRERNRKVQQYSNSFARVTNTIPTAASSNRPSAQANQSHTLPQRPSTPPGKNPSPTVSSPVSPRYVPPPAWFKDLRLRMTASRMFQLYAPSVLPVEVTPPMKAVAFPPHFDVNSISRMGLWNDQLLILAIDERSAPSNDPTPDIMAELLSKSGRLWTLAPDGESAVLFEEKLLPDNLNSFLVQNDRLWIAGHSAGYFDLQHLDFHHCRMNDGSDPPEFQAFTVGGGRLFAVGSFKVYSLDPISSQWTNLPQPFGTFSAGTGIPCLLTANNHWLCYPSASASLYNISKGGWTNLPSLSLHCAIADDEFFWFGGPSGLHRYNPASATLQSWPPASGVQGMSNPAMGEPYAMASQIPAASLEWVADRLVSFFKKLQKERARTHEDKNAPRDPLQLAWRIPGEISAVAKDGDFLWLGSNQRLLLLHTPSLSLVGYCKIDGQVSSLVASPDSVWVGTACGQQLLSRIRKQDFLSVPKGQWTPLAISPEERKAIISRWALRDQAMYAFYAGDDARVAELLGHLDPRKATLEEMFLLAFAYDALGVDKPEPCRDWHGRIASRYPDSPWAKIARDALEENEQNHKARQHQQSLLAKYDRNHDGALDQSERLAMEKDPAYQREAKLFNNEQLETQLREIMKKYDRDGNGKLDRDELENLRNSVLIFSQASPALLSGRKIIVAPLLTEKFPAVVTLLKKYDANHDGALNESELKALAHDLKK